MPSARSLSMATDANPEMALSRPPLSIEKADWPVWLGEAEGDVPALLRPLPEGVLRMWPIDKRVGKVRNDGLELLEQLAAPDEVALL